MYLTITVDWAALAQQWIQMKGTDVPQPQPTLPPSQQQHYSYSHQHQHQPMSAHDVIGEAPMDLDLDPPPSAMDQTWRSQTMEPNPAQVTPLPLMQINTYTTSQPPPWNNKDPNQVCDLKFKTDLCLLLFPWNYSFIVSSYF